MAILITSSGLVTTGTEGADDIRVLSGGITGNGLVINGLAGNDTIRAVSAAGAHFDIAAGSVAGPDINLGDGDDSFNAAFSGSTTSATNAVVLGGNGSDTITVSGAADAAISRVAGGNDADLITLQGTATYSAVGAGAGNDTIEVSGVTTLAAGATLGLGKGDDLLSGAVTISTGAGIIAGAGADTITIDALAGLTGTFVNGDSTVEGGAADVITIGSQGNLSIVRGKDGADTISITNLSGEATVAGNDGADVITVSGTFFDDAEIRGGKGHDAITLDEADLNTISGDIIGGAGHDTITFADVVVNNGLITVEGAAGIDSITFSGAIGDGTDLGAIRIDSLSDSTADALDTYDVSGLDTDDNATVDLVAGSDIGFVSAAAISGNNDIAPSVFLTGAAVTGSVTSGYMTFEGASASLATVVGYADAATRIETGTSQGRAVLFTSSGDDYLFIQGGSEGTSDDFLMEFNGASGSTIAAATITLKGDA